MFKGTEQNIYVLNCYGLYEEKQPFQEYVFTMDYVKEERAITGV